MKKLLAQAFSAAVLLPTIPTGAFAAAAAGGSLQTLNRQLAAPNAASGQPLNAFYDGSKPAAAPDFNADGDLPSGQAKTPEDRKAMMLQELDVIHSVFAAQYGPGLWKESHEGWNLDAQIDAAKKKVEENPNLTMDQYHEILRGFFNSMKDYHVSVTFNATEASSLPFGVVGANGRYFIAWIDRTKLSQASFPFNVGDEVVSFGGKKTADVVKQLQARLGNNTALTDRALASMILTSRKAASFGDVQKGAVAIGVKPKGSNEVVTRQLTWNYTPERITDQGGLRFNVADYAAKPNVTLPQMGDMLSPMQAALGKQIDNPFGLGAQNTWVPALGKKTWESADDAIFRAYIYKNDQGRSIGYVRIPSYEVDDANAAVEEFAGLVKDLQSKTDALVIDQVDNPGGAVLYLYALASMLTAQPLSTPPHHVAITQDDVSQALELLKLEPLVQSDEMAQKLLGPSAEGYPVDYGFFRRMIDYSRFVVDQWNAGKTLTDPVHIEGVDAIAPSATAEYTKPILLLINELDFSGGDFFPAIMQDNKRATLFGTRTAGAGGFIREVTIPNQVGIKDFVVTGSIAVRSTQQPIENLGVHADVQYAPTPADFQDGFQEYGKAVNAAVAKLLGDGAKPAAAAR